ncbi:ABC transporter ATP-binding protein/permease [Kineosporia rhizophila]|uniref:ABC transporter ATP-binding protein n=1 Tax=Kineosporia rhizophila TaxID=84633 RepID=UPI001E3AD0AC|nr:ABC transporter ATP-binding protein [Kineosporia rhizophila]MCE0536504.1 ABC transporter ATP-binding protein/permease [Kineosporia rhizophila]
MSALGTHEHRHISPTPETAEAPGVSPIRALWSVFGDRRRPLVLAVVLRALAAACMGVPVAVIAWSVEQIRTENLTQNDALGASAVVVAAVAGQYLLWFGANHLAWVSTFHAVGEGRIDALRHVERLPVGTVAARGSGDISAVLGADHEQIALFAHAGLMNLVGGAALPVATLAGLAVVDPLLAGVTALSIVAAAPVFVLVNRAFAEQSLSRADTLAEANGRIVEYVQGIATARSFHQVGPRLIWYREAVARMRAVNDALAVRITPLAYVSIGVVFLGVPLVVAGCGYGLLGGQVDAFTAVVFLVVVLRVYTPLVQVAVEAEALRLTDASLQRIARLRSLAPQSFPARETAWPVGHELTFEKVRFGYRADQPVLSDIDFAAAPGTTTALVGPSGAGKSTLLALAARFHDPDAGTVRLGGVPLTDLTQDQLFDAVTVVFQDVYLFQGTIRDNIALGRPEATDEEVQAAARAARCHDFVSALPDGYATRIGEGGQTLSGGERQRLSIARAILKNAPVVLLDEPTSALDPLNEQAIQAALGELTAGRTVLVVAHRLSTIRDADQILVLDSGRIAQRGRHEHLLSRPGMYRRLWSERERAANWRLNT